MPEKILPIREQREIDERAAKATEGPWYSLLDRLGSETGYVIGDGPTGKWREILAEALNFDNANLVAHSRTDIPRLSGTLDVADAIIAEMAKLPCQAKEMLPQDRVEAFEIWWAEQGWDDNPDGYVTKTVKAMCGAAWTSGAFFPGVDPSGIAVAHTLVTDCGICAPCRARAYRKEREG